MVEQYIKALVMYGRKTGLIEELDENYVSNQLLELFGIDGLNEEVKVEVSQPLELPEILEKLLDYAYEVGLLEENRVVYQDLFDTKIMGLLVPRPSEVLRKFQTHYQNSPKEATDYFYQLCQDSNYIRRDRIKKDPKWVTSTEYGDLDITINLSKPEKDPKAIAATKLLKQSGYPKCQLCVENEGYAGRVNHSARQNLRIIPVTIKNESWGFQYSPYVYYKEHCILLNQKHIPMKMDRTVFEKLFDFVRQFPHYMIGSNADLPIVGGSILSHEHFQGGNYEFAMAKAKMEETFVIPGYEQVTAGIVKWPMSVIRLQSKNVELMINLADHILTAWRGYSDEACFIFADTNGEPHNTITPIARKRLELYELDLVLRNNITTKECPFGVFHPHEELHHIKKENIGLIEVMGLAVLPARLNEELEMLKVAILNHEDIRSQKELEIHADWVEEFLPNYMVVNEENIKEILEYEVGKVFTKVLEHAGVYKRDESGHAGFMRFIGTLKNT